MSFQSRFGANLLRPVLHEHCQPGQTVLHNERVAIVQAHYGQNHVHIKYSDTGEKATVPESEIITDVTAVTAVQAPPRTTGTASARQDPRHLTAEQKQESRFTGGLNEADDDWLKDLFKGTGASEPGPAASKKTIATVRHRAFPNVLFLAKGNELKAYSRHADTEADVKGFNATFKRSTGFTAKAGQYGFGDGPAQWYVVLTPDSPSKMNSYGFDKLNMLSESQGEGDIVTLKCKSCGATRSTRRAGYEDNKQAWDSKQCDKCGKSGMALSEGEKYHTCPECEVNFRDRDLSGGKLPKHSFLRKPCPGVGKEPLKESDDYKPAHPDGGETSLKDRIALAKKHQAEREKDGKKKDDLKEDKFILQYKGTKGLLYLNSDGNWQADRSKAAEFDKAEAEDWKDDLGGTVVKV